MDSITELRIHIKNACEPWKTRKDKPPFSPSELIIMALACADYALTEADIGDWIATNFAHYARKPSSIQPRYISSTYRISKVTPIEEYLFPGFHDVELPAHRDLAITDGHSWRIQMPHAGAYLQHTVRPPKGSFPFLRLPAELCNIVYEMVMRQHWDLFPSMKTSSFVDIGAGQSDFRLVSKYSTERWDSLLVNNLSELRKPQNELYHFQSAQKTLSILLVNKQICREATPFFYRINTFTFTSVKTLSTFLKNTPSSRRQRIRQIAFNYSPANSKHAVNAFRRLARLDNLRKLHIDIKESKWMYNGYKGNELLRIPGLDGLRKIRGLDEVVFSKHCATIASHLKVEMESSETHEQNQGEIEKEGDRQAGEVRGAKRIRIS